MTSSPTPKQPLTLALVDDHDLSVSGLEHMLAPYADRVELLDLRGALARACDIDVVLYEPVAQSHFGSAMLRDLQQASEGVCAVWSWAPADQLPTSTARPYLSKRLTASQLVSTLEDLVSGRATDLPTTPGEDEVAAAAAAAEEEPEVVLAEPRQMRPGTTLHPQTPSGLRLTRREHEILTLITNGLTNAEIGEQLTLSINSIKTYIRQAYRKIDVERRAQAVAWGMTNGLGGVLPEDLDTSEETESTPEDATEGVTRESAGGSTLGAVAMVAS